MTKQTEMQAGETVAETVKMLEENASELFDKAARADSDYFDWSRFEKIAQYGHRRILFERIQKTLAHANNHREMIGYLDEMFGQLTDDLIGSTFDSHSTSMMNNAIEHEKREATQHVRDHLQGFIRRLRRADG